MSKSIYGYAQDIPIDSITGCLQDDYQCQQTFYSKQQNEIMDNKKTNQQLQQENTQLKIKMESLQKNIPNIIASSLIIGLIIGVIVIIVVNKKHFSKV